MGFGKHGLLVFLESVRRVVVVAQSRGRWTGRGPPAPLPYPTTRWRERERVATAKRREMVRQPVDLSEPVPLLPQLSVGQCVQPRRRTPNTLEKFRDLFALRDHLLGVVTANGFPVHVDQMTLAVWMLLIEAQRALHQLSRIEIFAAVPPATRPLEGLKPAILEQSTTRCPAVCLAPTGRSVPSGARSALIRGQQQRLVRSADNPGFGARPPLKMRC